MTDLGDSNNNGNDDNAKSSDELVLGDGITLNTLGFLGRHEQIPPRTYRPFEYQLYDAWVCAGHVKYFDEKGKWVSANQLVHPGRSFEIYADMIHHAREVLHLSWRGVLNAGKVLPPAVHFFPNDAWTHNGSLWKVTDRQEWEEVTIPGSTPLDEQVKHHHLPLTLLGFLVASEDIPPFLKKPFRYGPFEAWVRDGKTHYITPAGEWEEYKGPNQTACNFADYEDLIHYSREVLNLRFRGVLTATRTLPPPRTFEHFDCWIHSGKMWAVNHKNKWTQITIPNVQDDELPTFNDLGNGNSLEDLPCAWGYNPGDGLYWRGEWWMVNYHKAWEKYRDPNAVHIGTTHEPSDQLMSDLIQVFEDGDDPLFNILGRDTQLPIENVHTLKHYRPNDAIIINDQLWVRTINDWVQIQESLATKLIQDYDAKGIQHGGLHNEKLNHLLESATKHPTPEPTEDKGGMARELMEHKAELKRLKRSRLVNKLLMWFVFLGVLVALSIAAYGYVQRDLKSGFYTDHRDCEIMVGELKITGKRTYSYPYKSLWGQRWVNEDKVLESTTINLPGVKLAVVADVEPKWRGLRFSDGERGSPILKPALKYTLVTDKGIAMMSYGGFCKPANSLPIADDSKSPERSIVN